MTVDAERLARVEREDALREFERIFGFSHASAIRSAWEQGWAEGRRFEYIRAVTDSLVAKRATAREHVCPDCLVERADYEGPNDAWLPTCPNCGSAADPIAAETRQDEHA